MEYLINDTLKYSSSDGTLFCPEHNIDTITLNRVTNDLLLLFIQNAGVPVSRDNLLSELWEKKGLNASGNNLNHYVSLLRKALAQCGCTDVISTIPKYGFMFNVPVVRISSPLHFVEQNLTAEPVVATGATKSDGIRFYSRRKLILASVVIVLFLLIMSSLIAEKIRLSAVRSEVLRLQQCRFYVIDDLTRRLGREWVVKRMNTILKDQNILCTQPTNIYYSADKKINITGEHVFHELLSYCAYDSKAPCENYIYIRNEDAHENKN